MKENDKIKFVIDIDGVLRDIVPQMVKLYNNEFGENLTVEDIKDYDVEVSFPKAHAAYGSSSKWFFEKHADYIFLLSKPIEGVVEAIKRLNQLGEVIIITMQHTTHNKILALKWLDYHQIQYDKIFFVDSKACFNADFFVEDYPDNMKEVWAENLILIDAPYNKGVTEVDGRKVCRFESLLDFAKSVENFLN